MKKTPLTGWHESVGARMVEFAGYLMPLEYSGILTEHHAVRNRAGLFDVSHMGEFWVRGEGALPLLQHLTTNDVSKIENGQAQYSCLPNGKGGIVDDLIIYKVSAIEYMVVVNASNMQKDWDWMNSHNSFGAQLENISESTALIALQGPVSTEILQQLVTIDLSLMKSFHFTRGTVAGIENIIISTTGYTGAGGYELYCPNESALALWEAIMKAGAPLGLLPTGLAARDTLRLEMGYSLYGNDLNDSTSPIEAGLSWIVKFAEGKNFIDRPLLEQQKKNGATRCMVGFEMKERGIPRHDYVLVDTAGNAIGVVTSGTMSPTLQVGIGMGYVNPAFAKKGTEIFVQIRNKNLKAEVVNLPFVKK
jgi:aminomethyltransferase